MAKVGWIEGEERAVGKENWTSVEGLPCVLSRVLISAYMGGN